MTTDVHRRPGIIAITNESPAWTSRDVEIADEMWQLLLEGLRTYRHHAFKFYDDLSFLDAFDPNEWLVWNWGEELGGVPWSDDVVAEEIERRGLSYTGSSAVTLRLTQNRMWVKDRLRAAGLPTLPWCVCRDPAEAAAWTDYPAIVKGLNQHASVGIDGDAIVHGHEQLVGRVSFLREHYADDALVEPFLDTREFHVAVLGDPPAEALPPAEIDFSMFADSRDRLYTQAWKADPDSRGYREIPMPCPAPRDRPDWRGRLEALAVAACQALGVRDYARVDMRMLGDEPQVLDVNANPEMGPQSVVLAGARASGMTYGQMVSRIIRSAAARMPGT